MPAPNTAPGSRWASGPSNPSQAGSASTTEYSGGCSAVGSTTCLKSNLNGAMKPCPSASSFGRALKKYWSSRPSGGQGATATVCTTLISSAPSTIAARAAQNPRHGSVRAAEGVTGCCAPTADTAEDDSPMQRRAWQRTYTLRAAMSRPTRDRAMALGFALLAFVVALAQRPGDASSDTKIDLHVDPVAFLEKVASVWTPSIDFGAVQGAQYSGYLWPMGPIFALFHSIGFEPWVAHRLWLGLIFAISALGVLRLLDVLVGRPRGVAHLVAAALYMLNPYTVMFTGRTSITLLGYAALPWLLLVVFHGVRAVRDASGWRDWRGWLAAAAFALVLTSVGGGINGAVVGWMLFGPLVLLVYEPLVGSVRWRDSAGFLVRMGVLGTLASLWWIVPLVVHAGYGIDFLQFTEQPRTIWGTNSAPEALRLMAYWTSYIGVGFEGADKPFFTESGTMLFNPLVVGASLLVPALAVAGFIWTRRLRYAPFFLFVFLTGMAIEVAGFPDNTPSRDAMEWTYRNVELLRFMRTTQKAAPLVALGAAGLLGVAAQMAVARLAEMPPSPLRRAALVGVPAAALVMIALAALPLVRGTAVEKQLTWDRIPAAWTDAGDDLDRDLAPNSRAFVLPGQIFAYYRWGGTIDAILPRVTDKPVAVRYETPYSDPTATDLLWTIDRLVAQRRLFPGQLKPLLGLVGAGAVVTGSDDDVPRSGAVEASAAAESLAGQGLDRPTRSYGPTRAVPQRGGELGAPAQLPQVRRYDLDPGRGVVGVAPSAPTTIVDGGAEGLAALAGFGALPERSPVLYAGDLSETRAAPVRRGGGGRGGLGLQPAAAIRARVRAPEPRADAARDRAPERELRPHRPVPVARPRLPDRGRGGGRQLPPLAVRGRPARVSGARAHRRIRRQSRHHVGRRPLLPAQRALDRGGLRPPARRALHRARAHA